MLIDRLLTTCGDVALAVRSLRRSPSFTVVAVVTLALGIGANASMFNVFNGYVLQPTPYPEPDRLERIYRTTRHEARGGVSPADWLDLRQAIDAAPAENGYGDVAAYATVELSLAEPGRPAETAIGTRTTTNLFDLLGTPPAMGRALRREDDTPGNDHVLVISHRLWQGRFAGDPRIVGRQVRVDGEPHTIVGVLPEDFSDWRHLSWVDVFQPLALSAEERADRGSTWLRLVGRRAPGVTAADAASFVGAFGARQAKAYPQANAGSGWTAMSIGSSFLPLSGRLMISMLVALSGFVLLIACSNLANLLLARSLARARELAIRAALGSSRARLLVPLLLESLLVSLAGGLLAVPVARWTFDRLAEMSKSDSGVGITLLFDWRVVGWTFGACLFTALAFGVGPALFVGRLDLNTTLKSGGRAATGGRGQLRFRNLLVVGQFALAMVLLAGAALFARGLHELNHRREGWEPTHLVTGTVTLPTSTYGSDAEVAAFQRRVVEQLETVPGVASASLSYAMPFFGFAEQRRFVAASHDLPPKGAEPLVLLNGVSPHYFATVGTSLLAGRIFEARDRAGAPRVYVINRAMARGLFGEQSAIGQRLGRVGDGGVDAAPVEWGEVVGVVADVASTSPEPAVTPYQVYLPLAQEPRRISELAVRTSGAAPTAVLASIREVMMALDPDLPVRKLRTAELAIARANYEQGVLATILVSLALLGLGLACLGVYGVIARTTAQRATELAIRLAMGARPVEITRLVVGAGTRLALVGSAIGLLGAVGVARLFAMAFPAIPVNSVGVVIAAVALLVAIAQLASWLPARKAARVSPSQTLWAD